MSGRTQETYKRENRPCYEAETYRKENKLMYEASENSPRIITEIRERSRSREEARHRAMLGKS
jgi:hypothetical protein